LKTWKAKAKNFLFYTVLFFMTGVMMTSAGLVDSFGYPNYAIVSPKIIMFLGIIDDGLTTCIGLTLFFCAVTDMKILNPRRKYVYVMYGLAVVYIFTLWIQAFKTG